MSLYEQLSPRGIHQYSGYLDTSVFNEQKEVNPMEGVTIINNGLWNSYPDPEFKFDTNPFIFGISGDSNMTFESIWLDLFRQDRERRGYERDITIHTGLEGRRLFHDALREEVNRQLGIPPSRLVDTSDERVVTEQPVTPEFIWENPLRDAEGRSNYIVGYDPTLDSSLDSEGSISVNVENIPVVTPEEAERLMHSQTIMLRSRRAGHSASMAEFIRRQNELWWAQLRDPGELPDGIQVTREFLTEQEAIEYLDSLSQNTTENEENTDTIQDGESYGFSI